MLAPLRKELMLESHDDYTDFVNSFYLDKIRMQTANDYVQEFAFILFLLEDSATVSDWLAVNRVLFSSGMINELELSFGLEDEALL